MPGLWKHHVSFRLRGLAFSSLKNGEAVCSADVYICQCCLCFVASSKLLCQLQAARAAAMAIKQPDVSVLFNTHSAWKNGSLGDLLEFGGSMLRFSSFGTSGIVSDVTGLSFALLRDGVCARDEVEFWELMAAAAVWMVSVWLCCKSCELPYPRHHLEIMGYDGKQARVIKVHFFTKIVEM